MFSGVNERSTKIKYILGNKTHLHKFQKTEILYSMFSGHNKTKLKIRNTEIAGKAFNIQKVKKFTSK